MGLFTLRLTLMVSSLLLCCTSKAQNAFNTGLNGTTINLACNQNCFTVPVKIPHLKASSTYTVNTIPFNPYPFTSPTAIEVNETYIDDKFSHLQKLPFSFCFYDSTFDKFVIGSNGVISFDISNADCANDWSLETHPIPFLGAGSCSSEFDTQYVKYAVMGVYHDINPSIPTPGMKIEWRSEGTAPFRRIIVSFNDIALFGDNSQLHTSQVVLYESTGIIEVYVKNKPRDRSGTVWNGNLAILGVQRDDKLATAVAGKNCQVWEEQNTAYQFVPSGAASRFVKSEILDINHSLIATGDTITTTPGMLDLSFPSFCPTGNTGQYVIKTTYQACDNMMSEIVCFDTITINKTTSLNATAAVTPTSCGLIGTGTATVSIPSGLGVSPFTYVLTPVSPSGTPVTQTDNNVFSTLNAGTYTIEVTDAGGTCGNSLPITIVNTGLLTVTNTSLPTSCYGAANGTLNVTVPNGTPPIIYSLTPETPPIVPVVQTDNGLFNSLTSGNYYLTVKDNGGCRLENLPVTIGSGPPLDITYTTTPASCLGALNGSIQLNPSGTAPFQYSINFGQWVTSTTITGVPAGTHLISVIDANGCKIDFFPVTVGVAGGTLTGNATAAPTTCTGANNGSITVVPTSGSGPYEYSINNGTSWQTGNIFNGLAAGNYTVIIRENGVCLSAGIPVNIPAGSVQLATTTVTGTSCNGANDGQILVSPTNGSAPFQYYLNSGPSQPSNTFLNVSAGNHTVRVQDVNGCLSADIPVTIIAGPALTGTVTSTATACMGVSNGTVTVTASNGTPPYTYAIDGGPPQASNIFTNIAAGNHLVVIRSASGCVSAGLPVVVATGSVVNATLTTTSTACAGVNNGSITVTALNGSAPYTYTLDAGPPQLSNVFTGVSAGTHTVIVSDNFGCTSNNLSVTVAAGTVLTGIANATSVSCNGRNDGTIVANGTNGSAPYQYSLNGGPSQSVNTFTGLVAGSYSITITDAFGCISAPIPVNVDQPDVLDAAVSFSRNVNCRGELNGLIRIKAIGGTAPYLYSLSASPFQSIDSFAVGAGIYNVTVRDANNCITLIDNIEITEPAPLTASVVATTNATCDGGNDGTITIDATGGTAAYQYSLNGIDFQASNILSARSGTYNVIVKDAHNCTFSIAGVVVGLNNNLVLIPAPDPAPICEGTPIQLNVQTNATGFLWSPGSAAGLNNTTIRNPLANPVHTTLYSVVVTLGSCTATDEINVVVLPAPVPNAGPDAEICYGQDYQLQGSGGLSYTWSPAIYLDNPAVSNPQLVQPEKTMTYNLRVTDGNNCTSLVSDQVTVTVIPPIKVTVLPMDTVVHAGDLVQLNAYSIGTSYSWTPATGLNNPSISNPVATAPNQEGDLMTFQVTASTSAGCKGEGYATIRVYKGPDIYVANAFTPNNDGKNDLFIPFPVGIKELKYFKVFNRWGQLIYSSSTLNQGWDGRFAGAEQPAGVYVWMVQAITKDNNIINKKGTVTLIR